MNLKKLAKNVKNVKNVIAVKNAPFFIGFCIFVDFCTVLLNTILDTDLLYLINSIELRTVSKKNVVNVRQLETYEKKKMCKG